MEKGELITIGTEQVLCEDVILLDASKDSITVGDREGRKLELDLDAIVSIK